MSRDADDEIAPAEFASTAADDPSTTSDTTTNDGATPAGSTDPETVVEHTVQAEEDRVDTLLERDEGVSHSDIRHRVQKSMTENVNVFREESALRDALADIRTAREDYEDVYVEDPSRTYNTDVIHAIETRNILDLAEALTMGALTRTEFRGAHWRKEYQERNDDEWLKHTLVEWNDGEPSLYYKPVVLEGESKRYEPKIRSY